MANCNKNTSVLMFQHQGTVNNLSLLKSGTIFGLSYGFMFERSTVRNPRYQKIYGKACVCHCKL